MLLIKSGLINEFLPAKLTVLPLSPVLPVRPTGPSDPGDPGAPAKPSGPVFPLSPCKHAPVVNTRGLEHGSADKRASSVRSYPLSHETVATRRSLGSRETLQEQQRHDESQETKDHLKPSNKGGRGRPQAPPLLWALWLLANQLLQRTPDPPGLQQLQVFLVDPEHQINPINPPFKFRALTIRKPSRRIRTAGPGRPNRPLSPLLPGRPTMPRCPAGPEGPGGPSGPCRRDTDQLLKHLTDTLLGKIIRPPRISPEDRPLQSQPSPRGRRRGPEDPAPPDVPSAPSLLGFQQVPASPGGRWARLHPQDPETHMGFNKLLSVAPPPVSWLHPSLQLDSETSPLHAVLCSTSAIRV